VLQKGSQFIGVMVECE